MSLEDIIPSLPSNAPELQRRDDAQFQNESEALIAEAEDRRLHFMKKHRNRHYLWMTVCILCITAGASGFGWFLLVEGNISTALMLMCGSIGLPILLHFWTGGPIKHYQVDYKKTFMPKMAKALGGLRFHPERGIGAKIIGRTGVVPQHDIYHAEDCFMGVYKGVKVILSEATLLSKKNKREPAFKGVFALMELPSPVLEGHTIITADKKMAEHNARTRWQKLQPVKLNTDNPKWNIFHAFSDAPAAAEKIPDALLKELAETAEVFGNVPLTAALFGKKFIFLMIPCKEDMFEASDIFVPVATKQHALKCKKEIEKLLEIIDVMEVYKAS